MRHEGMQHFPGFISSTREIIVANFKPLDCVETINHLILKTNLINRNKLSSMSGFRMIMGLRLDLGLKIEHLSYRF